MIFSRSRPWRPRGPAFGSRAGARRRGCRHDDLSAYGAGSAGFDHGSEFDSSSPVGPTPPVEIGIWPALTRVSATYIHAARIDESGLRALARRAREQALDQLDRTLVEGSALPPQQSPDPDREKLILPPQSRRSA